MLANGYELTDNQTNIESTSILTFQISGDPDLLVLRNISSEFLYLIQVKGSTDFQLRNNYLS